MTKSLTWTTIQCKLGDLKEWDRNPVQISDRDAKQLARSLDKFDHVLPYVAAAPLNGSKELPLLDGHQRKMVELSLLDTSPDTLVDVRVPSRKLTEKERQELVVRLRKNTGEFDFDKLANFFDVPDLLDWGFSEKELQLGGFELPDESQDAEPQIDRAAELLEKWRVVTGDLWQIGEHRLLCGDSAKREDVERVMGGEIAILMITDPPYGVDYGELVRGRENQKKDGWEDIQNDALSDDDLFSLLKLSLHGAGALTGFVFHPAGERRWLFWNAVKENGWKVSQEIVWVKNSMVFGRADYQWRHEPCLYIKKDGARKKQEDRTQTTVWEVKKPSNSIHPTQKPVELFEIAIRNHTEQSEIVYEPFAGSGTTLVACQNLGRKGRAIEISPAYCAVILERMSTAFPELEIKKIE